MFVASLVERCGLETGVEEALDKLRGYRGKEAGRSLLTAMENLGWVPRGLLHSKGDMSVSSATTTNVE
ncbi:hypothetical protein IG631_05683 [Alternaria alternata]|nr:hypothetical protein IG631_05683 [Alternaria alternata]